jgi:hypothetical protein
MRGKVMNIFKYALIVCALWITAPLIFASESFHCGSHLIEEGMEKEKVIEYCGEPTSERGWTFIYHRGSEAFDTLVHFGADGTVNRIEEESE